MAITLLIMGAAVVLGSMLLAIADGSALKGEHIESTDRRAFNLFIGQLAGCGIIAMSLTVTALT